MSEAETRTGWGLRVVGALVATFLLAPMAVIVGMSFNARNQLSFPPESWGLTWYGELFQSEIWMDSVALSLRLAAVVSAVATILGYLLALAIDRGLRRTRAGVQSLVVTPLIAPSVAVGLALYLLFVQLGLVDTFGGLVLAHTALAMPYVVVNVMATLRMVDRDLERAAQSLGAHPARAFARVTLPLTLPGTLAGAVFAFVVSWDEVVVALFVSGPSTQTLPITMWTQMRTVVEPTIAAVATCLMLITVVALALGAGAAAIARRRTDPRTVGE